MAWWWRPRVLPAMVTSSMRFARPPARISRGVACRSSCCSTAVQTLPSRRFGSTMPRERTWRRAICCSSATGASVTSATAGSRRLQTRTPPQPTVSTGISAPSPNTGSARSRPGCIGNAAHGWRSRRGRATGRSSQPHVPRHSSRPRIRAAIGLIRGFYELGVQVPGDVAIVGFDGVEAGQFSIPALTTIEHPRSELGRIGVDALLDAIEELLRDTPLRSVSASCPSALWFESRAAPPAQGRLRPSRAAHAAMRRDLLLNPG